MNRTDTAPGIVVQVNLNDFTRGNSAQLNPSKEYLETAVVPEHYAYLE